MDGCRWLRRVQFRVGEVWLWHDSAPVGTREVYSTAEFEAQIRNVMRPVVGRFTPCCSDLASDLVEMGEIRSRGNKKDQDTSLLGRGGGAQSAKLDPAAIAKPGSQAGLSSPTASKEPMMTANEMTPAAVENKPVVFAKDGEVFASSRAVAEFFGKRHDNVLRDIDDLISHASELRDGAFHQVESPHPTVSGRTIRSYEMTRDGFTLLAMGFTGAKALQWKLRYIEAFNMMEAEIRKGATAAIDVRDPSQLATIAIQLIEVNKELEGRVEEMREDVAAHERLTKADGSLNITEAAKNLGIRPKELFTWMSHNGWIYKRPGAASWLGYSDKCNRGLLEHKSTTVLRADGTERISEQVRVTPLGLSRLAKMVKPVARVVSEDAA